MSVVSRHSYIGETKRLLAVRAQKHQKWTQTGEVARSGLGHNMRLSEVKALHEKREVSGSCVHSIEPRSFDSVSFILINGWRFLLINRNVGGYLNFSIVVQPLSLIDEWLTRAVCSSWWTQSNNGLIFDLGDLLLLLQCMQWIFWKDFCFASTIQRYLQLATFNYQKF